MHLRHCLLFTLAFSLLRPLAVQAQEKFEINVGVSTPGIDELMDTRWSDLGLESFGYNYYESLSELKKTCFKSTIYPSVSAELSYDLAESGFFKRLDLLGFLSYHSADYEQLYVVNNTTTSGTARELSVLIGMRYDIFKFDSFNMYTQLLLGGFIRADSPYWDYIYNYYDNDRSNLSVQVTFLGFNWRIGGDKSKWGAMFEFGYGTEYSLSDLPIFPGLRGGLSYKF